MNNFHPSSTDARVFQRSSRSCRTSRRPAGSRSRRAAQQPHEEGRHIVRHRSAQFQFEVNRLEAALAAAAQLVPQLKAALEQASAGVERAAVQLNLAQADYDRQIELFEKQVIAKAALDRYQRNLESAEQGVAEAKAAEDKARLAYASNIGNENTAVAQTRQQLEQAKYNLEEATVRAPCDGYVTNLQLVPGAIVSAAASVMPFVCDRDERNRGRCGRVVHARAVSFNQAGNYAEVVLPMYPGRVFPGKVPPPWISRAKGN